jgi:hypothetical protein
LQGAGFAALSGGVEKALWHWKLGGGNEEAKQNQQLITTKSGEIKWRI